MLQIDNLWTGYGDMTVINDVSIEVSQGSVVALLGPNGAGKTTLAHAIMGIVPAWRGTVSLRGIEVTRLPAYRRAEDGISLVLEGGAVFERLSVQENLALGEAHAARVGKDPSREVVLASSPVLNDRLSQSAGTLSGGERQMLAMARALLMAPDVLILDEPSIGLAPIIVGEVFRIISGLRDSDRDTTVLLIEQNANEALQVCDYAYILEDGQIALHGSPDAVQSDSRMREAYLGL